MLTLNCYVRGDDPDQVFPVEYEKEQSVGNLKRAIKKEMSPDFDHISANSLRLSAVSIPCTESLKEDVQRLAPADAGSLKPLDRLSNIFPSGTKDGNVHIIVERVPSRILLLTLNCYVRGDDFNRVFLVEYEKEQLVGNLKDAIKKKKSPHFDHISADSLDLWAVSIPCTESLKEDVQRLALADVGSSSQLLPGVSDGQILSLRPLSKLSQVFSKPPIEGHVHIIVEQPAQSTAKEADMGENGDIIMALKTNRNEAIKKARKAKSPSESAKSKEYKKFQRDSPIYDGRYDATNVIETTTIPIQLFHPVFGHFLDDISSDIPVPSEIAKDTVIYMRDSSALYDDEASRKAVLDPHLGRILGSGMGTVTNADGTCPDSALSITLTRGISEIVVTLLVEEKNNFGDGHCDPSIQVGLSMTRFWAQDQHSVVRDLTCCPTFLLATAGPWFTILGAVFTDKWIVQRLTDFVWVGLDATLSEPHFDRVARILYSLRRNLEKLQNYYLGLNVATTDTGDLHPRFYPLFYIKPLEFDPTCVTFHAKTTSGTPKDVVVKFVQRYGKEAHHLLAGESLAPQLFYYGKVGVLEGDPSYGHLRMVVMEYINGDTLDQMKQIPQTVMDQIRHAMDVLHDQKYVFGDLRAPNIMITQNEKVKLIDFDWAGVHMESQYPLLISRSLWWPAGVEALSIMKTEHDDDMLRRLLQALA